VDDELLEGQLAYYRARAGEYDEWFFRQGRHDRGPEWNRRWFSELGEVRRGLERFGPTGWVLELACGTGLWTVELARHAAGVTAIDASPEVLEINRARLTEAEREGAVRYVEADIFGWRPDAAYDAVFFGFWLSHVPPNGSKVSGSTSGPRSLPAGGSASLTQWAPRPPTRRSAAREAPRTQRP